MSTTRLRKVYPPGAPADSICVIDDCGLTAAETRALLKLRKMSMGTEEREVAIEVVDGRPRTQLRNREVYDFLDQKTGFRYLFDIRGLTDAAVLGNIPSHVGWFRFGMDTYLTMMEEGGPNEAYLAEVDDARLEVPGLYITWPDGSMSLIDGRHRVIKRFRSGRPHHRMIVIRAPYWQAFLLDLAKTEFFDPLKVHA